MYIYYCSILAKKVLDNQRSQESNKHTIIVLFINSLAFVILSVPEFFKFGQILRYNLFRVRIMLKSNWDASDYMIQDIARAAVVCRCIFCVVNCLVFVIAGTDFRSTFMSLMNKFKATCLSQNQPKPVITPRTTRLSNISSNRSKQSRTIS